MPAHRIALTIGYLLLACVPVATRAQSPAEWQALQAAAATKSDKIMAEANTHKGLLAQYQVMREAYTGDNSPAFRLIFGQYISWYQSFLGDYPDAMDSYSIGQPPMEGDSPSPLTDAGYVAHPALDAIPELARGYRIVLLNEAHNIPLTRSLTVQLLSKLRQEGFDYFAAETLYENDTALPSRGYPIDASGFYTREPVYAEMVRTALKLGFKVIAYEATSDAGGSDARETEQARHINERVFKADPHARLVVNAGWPEFSPALAEDEELVLPVQINGKRRGEIRVAKDASEDQVRDLAMADPNVVGHLAGLTVRKLIVVPGRIVNIVAG